MPELLEAVIYQRAALVAVGRTITAVALPDRSYLRDGDPASLDAVRGARIEAVDRLGKHVVLRTDGPTIGLHFGMSGRLVVDGAAAIERLSYGGTRDDSIWDRAIIHTAGGGALAMRDPRRFGWIELDPDLSRLGPDAASITRSQLRDALAGSRAALKARLLDQARIAGLGNLLVDELLWRASLVPDQPADDVGLVAVRRLHRHLRTMLPQLLDRGGSHTGDVIEHRVAGGRCPRDGAPLRSAAVGGRTTWWCPEHQLQG